METPIILVVDAKIPIEAPPLIIPHFNFLKSSSFLTFENLKAKTDILAKVVIGSP